MKLHHITDLVGHSGWMDSIAFNNAGTLLATSSYDSVRLWDMKNKVETAVIDRGSFKVAFNKDGTLLAYTQGDRIKLFDIQQWEALGEIKADDNIFDLSISPVKPLLITCDGNWKLQIFDLESLQQVTEIELYDIYALAFNNDGHLIAAGGLEGIELLKISTYNQITKLAKLDTRNVQRVAFSADGRLLASCHHEKSGDSHINCSVQLWDVVEGKCTQKFPQENNHVTDSATFSSTSPLFAFTAGENVQLWDHSTLSLEHTLACNNLAKVVAFGPDGNTLAVGIGNFVRLYEVSD